MMQRLWWAAKRGGCVEDDEENKCAHCALIVEGRGSSVVQVVAAVSSSVVQVGLQASARCGAQKACDAIEVTNLGVGEDLSLSVFSNRSHIRPR